MVKVSWQKLTDVVSAVYQIRGVAGDDADFIAQTLVQADLWGHQSHGVLRVGWYDARLVSGAMNPLAKPSLIVDAGAIAVLDGQHGIGQLVARQAVQEAVRRAKQHGVGVVSVRHSNHFGTCMFYTRMGAQQDCITLAMTNAGPNMAPWGGIKKMIGTNPWSIAAPAGQKAPMIMDVANSGVARGKIYLAKNRHEKIPANWAIDQSGLPTSDPLAALEGFILPMAGHKGYAIGVMVDVLSGVLSGSSFLDDVHGPYDPIHKSGAGHFFAAFNIEAFQPRSLFHARMEEYIERLKAVPLAQGSSEVFYPGEIEAGNDLKNRREGLFLPVDTLTDLKRVAQQCGLGQVSF